MNFRASMDEEKQAAILSRAGEVRVALHVDEIIGNREIVVKSLGKQLSQVKGLSGGSILADGSVVLILDIAGLMRAGASQQLRILYRANETAPLRGRNVVMVETIRSPCVVLPASCWSATILMSLRPRMAWMRLRSLRMFSLMSCCLI